MKTFMLAALIVVALPGCQSGEEPRKPAAPDAADLLKLRKMKNAFCACADRVCVDKTQADYAPFSTALASKYTGERAPSEEMIAIEKETEKCAANASRVDDVTAGH